MSTNDDLDHDDDTDDGADKRSAPKALRDQNAKLTKELEDLRKQLTENSEKLRARDLADTLEKHNAPKRLAKYAARDLEDTSEDAVLEWLKENGEDFGWSPDDSDDDEEDTSNQARRISRASSDAIPPRPDTSSEKLNTLRSASAQELIEKGYINA